MKFKVKNISKDPRQFRENGKNVIVMPGQEIETSIEVQSSNVLK